MNLTRKLIRLVDLRMHHFVSGEKSDASSRLHRAHSIEELAVDHTHFRTFYPAKRTDETSCY